MPVRYQDLGDLVIWPLDQEGARYAFLPVAPSIQKNPDGQPRVSLIEAGEIAFLSVSTEWMVSDARLEAVRSALEALHDEPVQLTFAAVDGVQAALEIGPNTRIEAQSTSGMPPYAAMFSAQLPAEAKAIVQAALAGQEERVTVRYSAVLTVLGETELRLRGQLDGHPTRQGLAAAVADGRVEVIGAGPLSAEESDLLKRTLALGGRSPKRSAGRVTVRRKRRSI
jgi:hypothetical protein